MRVNIQKLMGAKSQREHRRITLRTVADETKLTRHTIYGMANDTIQQFPKTALVTLCAYFDCPISELLVLEDVPDEAA